MKKFTCIIACILIASRLLAQDCARFIYMQTGKTIEMSTFNKKGDVEMKSLSTISDVTTSGSIITAKVATQVFDKKGNSLGTSNAKYSCNGNAVSVEMDYDAGQQTNTNMQIDVKQDNNTVEYPTTMQVGDHLKDGTSIMDFGNGKINSEITVKVYDRMVLAKESVTTPAGTWDCYKISYKTANSSTFKGEGADTLNKLTSAISKFALKFKKPAEPSETTIWYAPDFGLVKMETKNMMMELTAIK